MFTLSTGSKQINRFLPEARNEHGQNKALRCDPILIEVDGKTPTGFSSSRLSPRLRLLLEGFLGQVG